jgi:hypothetical protein
MLGGMAPASPPGSASVLKVEDLSHRPRKPLNPMSRPHARARYPVSGRSIYMCFRKRRTDEGIFFTSGRRTRIPAGGSNPACEGTDRTS